MDQQIRQEEAKMSTSLLYHGFGIKGSDYERTRYMEGAIIFTVRQRREHLRCPRCNSLDVIKRGEVERRFKMVPIGRKAASLELSVARVGCTQCGAIRQVAVDFAETRRSYTKSFERYVIDLSKCMTIKDVAKHLCVSWDTVKDIQKSHLECKYGRPDLKGLRQIAMTKLL
jgi:transposase